MWGLHVEPGHALLQVIGRGRLEFHQVAQASVDGRVRQNDGEQLGIDTPVCKVLSQVVRCIQGNYDKQYLK